MDSKDSLEQGKLRRLAKAQRQAAAVLLRLLRFQDLMVLMMVAATIASAYATWRATRIADQIYRRSERPYMGVQDLRLNLDDTMRPCVEIHYRDFGTVPSSDTKLSVWATADGRPVSYDPMDLDTHEVTLRLGVLAPGTPYLFAAYFPRELIPLIVNGRTRFVVSVEVAYKDAAGEPYCYHMDFRYYAPTKTFDPAGGSDSCTENQSRPAVRKAP